MKKTRFTPFLILLLLLSLCAGYTSQAQGFFTKSPHAANAWSTRVNLSADGYQLKNTYTRPFPDGLYYLGNLHLNNAGQEVAWDSVEVSTGLDGPYYTWLLDNDLLLLDSDFPVTSVKVKKVQLDGAVVWSQLITSVLTDLDLLQGDQNAAGAVFVTGTENNSIFDGGTWNALLFKFGLNGEMLWSRHQSMPDSSEYIASTMTLTLDGGCMQVVTITSPSLNKTDILYKISATGEIEWTDTTAYFLKYIQSNSQGEIFIFSGQYLEKRDNNGQILWTKDLHALFQKENIYPSHIVLAENGDVLVIGVESNTGQHHANFFARFNPAGNLLWKRKYALLEMDWDEEWDGIITGSIATPDNGFLIAGLIQPVDIWRLFALKIDANGNIYPGQVAGQVALDANVSCSIDSFERALVNWKIQLTSPDYKLYTTTDSSGHYEMRDVPGDNYVLSAVSPSSLWESCAGSVPVAIPDTGVLSVVQDLPIQVAVDCPFMTLDIATFVLRRCSTSVYTVHYCNIGATDADSAYIQIILDPYLNFNTANIPYTQQGDTLYFLLGNVPLLECGNFTFDITVDCNSAALGQTLCVRAHIFPDTICNALPAWSGALLEGTSQCAGDSVHFELRNIGNAPTSNGLNYIVVDDHVIMFQQPLPPLAPQEIFPVTVPADGSTWRLIADQEPHAPGLERPSVGVEGCGMNGSPSLGFLLQYANRDGNPFTDLDCREVIGSYDPNDKQAFPQGVHAEHFIEPNQPIDYQIRFQNTGTDTAFTVVVKDTLSSWLDPATVRPGAASHPYTWSLSGAGILTFTFNHILLPDSNVNEATSHGFIQFSIDQHKDLPVGTFLENRAGIYFDLNAPVMTNTVWHTIGHDFLPSATREPTTALPLLQVWPNPANQITTVWTEKKFRPGQRLLLRDALGRVVQEVAMQDQSINLSRKGLPAGLYFLELRDAHGVLAVGKIMW